MRLRLTPPSLPGPKFRIGASHWHAEGLSVGCLMGLPHAFSFRVPRPEQRSSRSPRADGREVARRRAARRRASKMAQQWASKMAGFSAALAG